MLYTTEIAEALAKSMESLDVKSLEEGGTFRVVATDETKDRDGDIITLDGWEVDNYLKNPVILANHTYLLENIIGKATKIYAENNQIIVEGVFSKSNPLGILAQRLYEEGMLKTVSVGFIGKERQGEKITKKELLELSFVAVPSNPSAVSLDGKIYEEAVQKGLIVEDYSGCVMLDLANGTFDSIRIDEIDMMYDETIWGGGGKSYDKHVTLLYGLSKNVTKKQVMEKIEYKNNTIEIEGIGVFENDQYDVLIAKVKKDSWLESANNSLKELEYKNDYPDYTPHITIAYLKKGRAINYITEDFKILGLPTIGIKYSPSGEYGSYRLKQSELVDKKTIETFTSELSEMKTLIKSLADDKAEEKSSEQARKAGQELAKALSSYLQTAKKTK